MSGTTALGELMAAKKTSLDPRKTPESEFELFSIPAFDAGTPEVVKGSEIGSTKQVVEDGDVLLSKIIPQIRRAWVVDKASDRPTIGSSEWIIFRSESFDPSYLRHVLISDRFHQAFMQTVAGVGGSLLRARPAYVADIEIPLPALEEQKRIASILDAAEQLRTKRQQAIDQLDTLSQAIFHDMFGDPQVNPMSWETVNLGDLCEVKGGKRLPKGSDYAEGITNFPYIRVVDFKQGHIEVDGLKFLTSEVQAAISSYTVMAGDVIISIAGSIGKIASVPHTLTGANLTENAAKLVIKDSNVLNTEYLAFLLRSDYVQHQMLAKTGQVTIGKLALFRIASLKGLLPPIELQRKFNGAVDQLGHCRKGLLSACDEVDNLFASLQQRAFRGDL